MVPTRPDFYFSGYLQILSLNFHETIWNQYNGWLRTITSYFLSEETVKYVIQEEFFHNFHSFKYTVIYQIKWPKAA